MLELMPCRICGGAGKINISENEFIGRKGNGKKLIVCRIQIVCKDCKNCSMVVLTKPLENPVITATIWAKKYRETEFSVMETKRFRPYVEKAMIDWNTRKGCEE